MTKALYVGVNGVARKVKAIYVGVNGVARKVKNGYVGVNGVARQFFAGVEMVTVTIVQPTNGSIKATYDGVDYTSTFQCPKGSTVTFTCTPNSGYTFSTFTQS